MNIEKKLEKNKRRIMLENINKNINSSFFITMLRKNWNKNHNLNYIGNLIGELYVHHIINKDGFGFEYYITQIEKLYSELDDRKISPQNFELQKAKLISLTIAYKLGIDTKNITSDSMLKVKNYFLQEYVVDGYVSHSFPDAYYDTIIQNGLISTAELRQDKPIGIEKIQEIFMS